VLSTVRSIRWSSILMVAGAAVVAALCLLVALRGRPWAWVPFVFAAAIVVREVRFLQRDRRRPVGFDEPDRRDPPD
jgi:4-hydroxybenzoate polyprenyltransferase